MVLVVMKIIFYNIRGLGGRLKKRDVRQLVKCQKPDMLCLQVSKFSGVDRKLCSFLWEGDDFDWFAKDAEGRYSGLIVLSKRYAFLLSIQFQGNNFLGVTGSWGSEQIQVSIVNVYAPCDLRGKRAVWDDLLSLMYSRVGDKWCVLGDFNAIKSLSEWKGVDGVNRAEEMQMFGDFISEAGLIDLPLIGRKFTWYKADGKAMSRLDRFLISESWLNSWNDLS